MSDSTLRSIVKTISWRICGSGATFGISYAILGDFSTSSTIALIQLSFNTVLYWVHERVWNKVLWGRAAKY
jgi:uncharacterized membrane protein